MMPITATTATPNPFQYHFTLHPRIYIAPHTPKPIHPIDADPHKQIWSSIPWGNDFDDIRGADDAPSQSDRPNSKCTTKVKMTWDEKYLYILALIESDFEITATFNERNAPIYQQDSDFEVFLDPSGCCQHYKELELNAINTVWNLMLDKTYWDGGQEHSGRIAKPGDELYYEVSDQITAVKILEGSINNSSELPQRNTWVVEMALSHYDTLKHGAKRGGTAINMKNIPSEDIKGIKTPVIGDRWRINFSRVENKGDINWTWQKQKVWDPTLHKHVGKVNMHLPDAWGYVQFGPSLDQVVEAENFSSSTGAGEISTNDIQKNGKGDLLWPLKLTVANMYYAQKQYQQEHDNKYTADLNDLQPYLDADIMKPFHSSLVSSSSPFGMKLTCSDSNTEFSFKVYDSLGVYWVSITDKRLIEVGKDDKSSIQVKDQR